MSCQKPKSSPPEPEPEPTSTSKPDYCILCVGLCAFDVIHTCDLFPQENTKKFSSLGYWQRGGNCSNMCTVLRNFDANCEFLGMTTLSPAFAVLLQDFKKRGIVTKNCPGTIQDPPICTIILSTVTGTRSIICSKNNFPWINYQQFRKVDLRNYTWINFEANDPKEVVQMMRDVCTFNNKYTCTGNQFERKITTSLDLERKDLELLCLAEHVDNVIIGKEMSNFLGFKTPYAAAKGLRRMLKAQEIRKYQKPNIIVPWGSHGAAYLSANDEYELIPPYPPEVVRDTLGAGDTFCASFVFASHVLHKNLRDAITFANRVAGYKIGHRGYDNIKKFFLSELSECPCPIK